jgi:hypothetical protein
MTNSAPNDEQKKTLAKRLERKEYVENCCTVSGPGLFGFFDDVLKHDNWVASDAMNFLAGIKLFRVTAGSPIIEVVTLNNESYFSSEDPDITRRLEEASQRLWSIWKSGRHENFNPPSYYIEWALSKKIKIDWLDYAEKQGLYKSPEPKNSANLSLIAYETDLLKLLNLAVLEFFNPRRASDAKKDEVTQWLKDKGANLNIVVSDNVADSIFTIIKPKNHNPKIKRVQSID